jgi:signal transduction histidine kinase
MSGKSLRLRLLVAAAISLIIAVLLAGVALVGVFERYVVRRIGAELDTYVRQLAANVSLSADGSLQISRQLADPRFDIPLSGLYWQVSDDATGAKSRSRSLWDHVIELPEDPLKPGAVHRHDLPGPNGEMLFVSERGVIFTVGEERRLLRIIAGIDRNEIIEARSEFAGDVAQSLAILAAVLLAAAWGQIAIGLKPLEAVRRSVNAVRSGEQKTIRVDGPEEIMPLVAEVNSLLEAKAKTIEAAKARASNLAHALKTPLTVLATDAERLARKGETEIASELHDLAFGMRRHIDRELSRVRLQSAAATAKQSTGVRDIIEGVMRTLSRSPKGATVSWRIEITSDARTSVPEEDATELFGVLLDNAVKWSRSEIRVAREGGNGLCIIIEDDGPGVSADQLVRLGQRGIRLDETTEGSGLGLAIAADILEAYGGEMRFRMRQPHGLQVVVALPAVHAGKLSAPK